MIEQQITDTPRPPTRRARRSGPAVRPVRPTLRQRLTGPGGPGRAGWAVRAPLPIAMILWLLALRGARLDRMGDLGLLQALPLPFWLGLVVITVGFVAVLRDQKLPQRWPAAYVLGLIAMVHATPSVLYPTLRYAWAWKHIAIVDAVMRHNGTVPNAHELDIYNRWPGFFDLNALFLRATGLHSALGYASWYPVLANVLLIGPLLLIYRSLTKDRRLVWGGVWLYFATSWVGQDYFAPQAFAYFLFLIVIGLVLRQLAARRAAAKSPAAKSPGAEPPAAKSPAVESPGAEPSTVESPGGGAPGARALTLLADAPSRGGWRLAPFGLLLVLIGAIVTSHPLTPMMLISFLLLLALPRANRAVVLPVLAAAAGMTLLWDATVARPYLASNISALVGALSSPDRNAVSGFAGLAAAAPAQVMASWVDRGLTATVLLLAFAAVLRRRWRRTPLPLLLLAPFPLLLANPYGGEMIFRAYLFALPAAAFLIATLIVRTPRFPRTGTVVRSVVLLALLAGTLCGYYSKEAINYFTPQEVAAGQYLAENAPPGSQIVVLTADLPGFEMRYEQRVRTVLAQQSVADRQALLADPASTLESTMSDPRVVGPSFLVLTRAQAAECELTGVFPADTLGKVRLAASDMSTLRPVFANHDAVVYRHVTPVAGTGLFAARPR
ncbi:glycosyltransferase [Kitasatospora sp. NBC_00240]|uniref:glycosyltransferase n=1 Tax=Kitasatospora sp. NBC_00240 TaxID=2903567 RepID=UPI00225ABC98|nr:glycosyltransferase [Kitasatospora sp. NBC_00240]MCX5209448.1 glycosyltransferase [Kitasatospora sp. NBC_00240]